MQVNTYNIKGEKVGTIKLPERVFGAPWNPALVRQVYDGEQANKRIPWAHAKGRSEIRGGGRKPWRQKGLGRARHGSIRSPIWIGGGVTHGPTKARSYKVKINKKMKRGALFSVFSRKLKDKEIVLFDKLILEEPKTKEAFSIFKDLRANANFRYVGVKGGRTLIAMPKNEYITRAIRNLPFIDFVETRNLNTSAALNYRYIIFDKLAIKELEQTYGV